MKEREKLFIVAQKSEFEEWNYRGLFISGGEKILFSDQIFPIESLCRQIPRNFFLKILFFK